MSLGSTIYNVFLRRTSTFIVTIMASAFVFERTFDIAADTIFENLNKGVCILKISVKFNYKNLNNNLFILSETVERYQTQI